jgi:ubiquinone/menaquinone biosynthesis C-methylase UbiE
MAPIHSDINWQRWFERWEAMQNCYIPQRLYRFDLMLQLADLPCEGEVEVIDLGCGPGSLALCALQHYPNARVIAVDACPILLLMGKQVAKRVNGQIEFLQADIRQPGWWATYEGKCDLVMSATSLHWLSAANLAQTYQRTYQVLKPGGRFMNSDHVASDDSETQIHYRQMLQVNQRAAFREMKADDWEGFWQSLGKELGRPDLQAPDSQVSQEETGIWEGTDDGLPKQFHINALRQCGFVQIAFYWQDLGEAVMGARKPLA